MLIGWNSLAGETIMSITYGVDVRPQHDPYIELAERAADAVVTAAVPGAFLVDAIPILKYVPSWMPGAGFKRQAKEWKKDAIAMVNVPFRAAKQGIVSSFPSEIRVLMHFVLPLGNWKLFFIICF